MNFDTLLLLGSMGIPALGFVFFLCGFPKDDDRLKKLAYLVFGFPCIAGILLFLRFDSVNGYCFEFLYERMGLHELGITFHLGLNGVSSPLFAMAGIVGKSWTNCGSFKSGSFAFISRPLIADALRFDGFIRQC